LFFAKGRARMLWWLLLYWPAMLALIGLGSRVAKRYPEGSQMRHRADMALGCGILALPIAPIIWAAVRWFVGGWG
jgi:hypothetical protein